ncbi:hypothetical protein L3N51_00329 [Metallosphaera sp. J1]|uniref:hypothetical protein n=1 Tax=Metallosphaera TaxID=41980 RepID=UPI001EE0024B|nr:hypothetical protein [Metallosphaera javensis (ex Hofmann et al. 2022)]MCG3108051.1 hypothetical protein [Metallosphaera javensis (ex Hofmann et al. 2022)]BCS91790.1 MAG: hypothetical protein MjAS7_0398 [Metallosphaera javensis (ex Sakai et al. 2022)]
MNFNLLALGTIFLVIGLLLYISLPLYYPGYSTVNNVFKSNQGYVVVGPAQTVIVKNLSAQKGQAIIFLVLKGNANVSLLSSTGHPILDQQKEISIELNQSDYEIQIINLDNQTSNISFTYGLFNAQTISNFYYSLGILQTFLDVVILAGGAMILWYIISWFVTRRK